MGDEFKEDQIIAFYQFVDIVEDQKNPRQISTAIFARWESNLIN